MFLKVFFGAICIFLISRGAYDRLRRGVHRSLFVVFGLLMNFTRRVGGGEYVLLVIPDNHVKFSTYFCRGLSYISPPLTVRCLLAAEARTVEAEQLADSLRTEKETGPPPFLFGDFLGVSKCWGSVFLLKRLQRLLLL